MFGQLDCYSVILERRLTVVYRYFAIHSVEKKLDSQYTVYTGITYDIYEYIHN